MKKYHNLFPAPTAELHQPKKKAIYSIYAPQSYSKQACCVHLVGFYCPAFKNQQILSVSASTDNHMASTSSSASSAAWSYQ